MITTLLISNVMIRSFNYRTALEVTKEKASDSRTTAAIFRGTTLLKENIAFEKDKSFTDLDRDIQFEIKEETCKEETKPLAYPQSEYIIGLFNPTPMTLHLEAGIIDTQKHAITLVRLKAPDGSIMLEDTIYQGYHEWTWEAQDIYDSQTDEAGYGYGEYLLTIEAENMNVNGSWQYQEVVERNVIIASANKRAEFVVENTLGESSHNIKWKGGDYQ